MEHYVLQDLMLWVKGSCYVIAAIAMAGFVPYWYYLTGGGRKQRGRRPPRAPGAH